MIQPFLKDMTKSELHAVMTGGFATIAGSVLGAYINFGVYIHFIIIFIIINHMYHQISSSLSSLSLPLSFSFHLVVSFVVFRLV